MARIAVIIPNWNGAAHLPACLDSLRRQSLPAAAVYVADNASRDDSLALLARGYPEVSVIALPTNRGFTGACNAGSSSPACCGKESRPLQVVHDLEGSRHPLLRAEQQARR